jgi:WD40 repeat protein
MSSNNFFESSNNNNINFLFEFSNKDTNIQKKSKIKGNNNYTNIAQFNISNNNDKNIITGDRFIPLKNNSDNNLQNFILNSSPFNFNSSNSPQKVESISSSEGKIEKNYINFIIDNMLKISSDKFVVKNNNIRKNKIFSFSKRIYSTATKNKLNNNFNNNEDIDMNQGNSLNLSRSFHKNKNNVEYVKNNKIYFGDDIYNHINDFYREKEKIILSKENNYESDYNKIYRKIPKTPFRVLDAPNLIDDYYLNLLDWGKENIIAVALSDEIYLWNDTKAKASLLMTYTNNNSISEDISNNIITSLSWMENGINLGIGLPDGIIQLWDINKKIRIREIFAHNNRVSCLSWNNNILSSGSKDRYIKNFDIRIKVPEISKIKKHKQEVCSLKYSIEGDLLASGGNDNMAYIWDIRNLKNNIFNFLFNENTKNPYEIKPYSINNLHQAAVKAMNWCPWKRHVLGTGGGSKDKSIKIYSCDCNKLIKNINTGSQVCSLIWNEKEKEIISSHGFNKNQIIIWNYEKSKKICELKGHMNRVLYMTKSPDENVICSGSGDETLRFWKINEDKKRINKYIEKDEMTSNILIH